MSKTPYVIVASVDSDETTVFGIVAKTYYDAWNDGDIDLPDLCAVVYSGADEVALVHNWPDAMKFINDNNGEITDVQACISY